MADEEMMRRVMEALPTMPIRAVVEPTQKKPQREWQGLTDEEREEATGWSVEHIEAKLKEKNT